MVALLNMKETQLDIGQQGERRKMLCSWMEKECEGGRITSWVVNQWASNRWQKHSVDFIWARLEMGISLTEYEARGFIGCFRWNPRILSGSKDEKVIEGGQVIEGGLSQ